MTTANHAKDTGESLAHSSRLPRLETLIPFFLILFAVSFNLYYLYPEAAGDLVSGNDSVYHLLMVEMAAEAITQGRNFTDPWQASMGMGYPLFHYYHHFPHITIAFAHLLTLQSISLTVIFNWTTYLLLSFFPLSIYWGMRSFGFDRLPAAMGGLVAPLISTTGILGFGYASYVFQGWGVHAQLWAMVLLPPALALGYRVIQNGRGYFWATLLLAATMMSHLMFGYLAFITLGVLTLIQPARIANLRLLVDSIWPQWLRLAILALLVLLVTSYFLVPTFIDRTFLNNSVFLDTVQYDSYGHPEVLQGLVKGNLFDYTRFPSLTILLALGFAVCLYRWREARYLMPAVIFVFWLILYFGRATWGPFIDVLPMSRFLHMHRFIAGVHLGGIMLIAAALAAPWSWAVSRKKVWYPAAALVLSVLVLAPAYIDRHSYLADNAAAIDLTRRAIVAEDADLGALFRTLKQLPPGRVYSGQQRGSVLPNWSDDYHVGNLGVDDLLHLEGLDMVGMVYHGFSLNSDASINFNEQRRDHYDLYNVRYVVAPEGQDFPDFVQPVRQFGRHRLYQVETTGYFDLVGSDLSFSGESQDHYLSASTWLVSRMPAAKQYPIVTLGGPSRGNGSSAPLASATDIIPSMDLPAGPYRGTVLSEKVGNDYFESDVEVERDSMLLLKATYHPNWRATVGGVKADTVMLMPSFVGVQLPPGSHKVRLEYRPRRLRMILLGMGLLTLTLIALAERRSSALSNWLATGVSARISSSVNRPKTPRPRQTRRRRKRQ